MLNHRCGDQSTVFEGAIPPSPSPLQGSTEQLTSISEPADPPVLFGKDGFH